MKQLRKIEYLTNQVRTLKNRLCNLEQENRALMNENASLKNINTKMQCTVEDLTSELSKIREDYQASLEEMLVMRDKYKTLVLSVKELKKSYKKEMDRLLLRLKKQA